MQSCFRSCFTGALLLAACLSSARADYSSSVLGAGPLVYYRLNESVSPLFDIALNSGTEGSTVNGVYVGAATHPVPGVLAGDTAASFTGGYVQVPFDPGLNTSGSFSVEAWLNPATTQTGGNLVCALGSGHFASPRTGWLLYQAATGWNWRMYNLNGTSFSLSLVAGPAPVAGNWYHVVVSYDTVANSVQMYVNGVAVGSGTPVGTPAFVPNSDSPFTIGARSDISFQWSGVADEVVIYTNVLSAGTVAAHYAAASTNAAGYAGQVLASAPAGYWRLSEPALTRPIAANTGSLGAAANGAYYDGTTTSTGPRPPGYPLFEAGNNAPSFDGTSGYVRIPQTGNLSGAGLNSVSEATFLCWIKRNGPQGNYKGILAMRPLSSGLYLNTDDTLNYSWKDDSATWSFNSGLIPPDGEWTMAAVVVQPDHATFYMGSASGGFVTAINPVAHTPADFTSGPFAVGQDINFAGSTRFFNGAIDEAAVFTYALPQGFLESLFFTTVGSNLPPVMVSDPPFLSPTGTVYSTTTFTITPDVAGTLPLSYQWRTNGVPIPGATSLLYVKANAATSDSGNYDVVVTNQFGAVTSMVVTVTVNAAIPPSISVQPVSRSTYAGGTASFSVVASGTAPLSYQWTHAGTNLPGATVNPLVVPNVDATKTGPYSVTVANVAGSVPSSSATLSLINPVAGSYEAAVVGYAPLAYWRLDETSGTTAFDHFGGHDGTYNNVTLGVAGALHGDTDTAAGFDGGTSYVGVTPLFNNLTHFTMMGWINRGGAQGARTGLFGQNDNVEFGYISDQDIQYWDGQQANNVDAVNSFADGVWGFLTVVSDGTNRTLYVNGQKAASVGGARTAPYTTAYNFNIGGGGVFDPTGNFFLGSIDDVALYDKALTASQINTLYLLGNYGTTTPPLIVQQPQSQTVIAGATANFAVIAAGSPPFTYQWKSNGVPIAGATSASLSLPNVYYTYAAGYSVSISNGAGATNSATANLSVAAPPIYCNLTNGLVLHLKFDGDLNDSSGHTNDAAPSGSPTFVTGRIGSGAIHVESLGTLHDFVYVTNSPDLSFSTNDSWSIAFWVNYTGTPNDLPMICNALNSTYNPGWVFTDEGGKIEYTLVDVDTGVSVIADPVPGSPSINNGAWHHIVLTIDKAGMLAATYVDGAQVDLRSITGLGSLDTTNNVVFGQDPSGTYGETSNINGSYSIDDVGIWRRALSSYEAESIYAVARDYNHTFDTIERIPININRVGTFVDLSWQAGTLLQAANAAGPYTPVPGAAAPFYRTTPTATPVFFRVQQ